MAFDPTALNQIQQIPVVQQKAAMQSDRSNQILSALGMALEMLTGGIGTAPRLMGPGLKAAQPLSGGAGRVLGAAGQVAPIPPHSVGLRMQQPISREVVEGGARGTVQRGVGPMQSRGLSDIGSTNPAVLKGKVSGIEAESVKFRNQMVKAAQNRGWDEFKKLFATDNSENLMYRILNNVKTDDELRAFYNQVQRGK